MDVVMETKEHLSNGLKLFYPLTKKEVVIPNFTDYSDIISNIFDAKVVDILIDQYVLLKLLKNLISSLSNSAPTKDFFLTIKVKGCEYEYTIQKNLILTSTNKNYLRTYGEANSLYTFCFSKHFLRNLNPVPGQKINLLNNGNIKCLYLPLINIGKDLTALLTSYIIDEIDYKTLLDTLDKSFDDFPDAENLQYLDLSFFVGSYRLQFMYDSLNIIVFFFKALFKKVRDMYPRLEKLFVELILLGDSNSLIINFTDFTIQNLGLVKTNIRISYVKKEKTVVSQKDYFLDYVGLRKAMLLCKFSKSSNIKKLSKSILRHLFKFFDCSCKKSEL